MSSVAAPLASVADGAWLLRSTISKHIDVVDDIEVDEWADRNRMLPRETSSEPGPWRTSRTPYMRQILQDLSDASRVQTVVLQFGTQLGKSEAGLCWTGYIVDHAPAPMMIIQPTVDLAKRYSKQRVAALIRSTPAISSKVKESRSRDSGNTTLLKEFPGGLMIITGANSAAGLASMPARFIHADEIDDYPLDVDGQGDPLQLATARQDTFARRKNLYTSSPKRPKGFSSIEAARETGSDSRYHVPCPHCGHFQELVWAADPAGPGLVYIDEDPSTAHYVCAGCQESIAERFKPGMLAQGQWIAKRPDSAVRSYLLSSLYSPLGWCSWEKICDEHCKAMRQKKQGDDSKLKAWTNTRLALTYEEEATRLDGDWLRQRRGKHSVGKVPAPCLVLTSGVDTQDNRLEVSIWGWGPGEECAIVRTEVIWGDPARTERSPDGQPTVWERLDDLFEERYEHESGATLGVEAVAIDTGGHFTHAVYDYCRRRVVRRTRVDGAEWIRRTYAIRGEGKPGLPVKGRAANVDINWQGKVIKSGVKLWHVGTISAKDWLHHHLKVDGPGPGFVHIAHDLPDEWFAQMASEQRLNIRTAHGFRIAWILESGKRNEAWDCAVYALFAAHALDLHRFTERMWARLRDRLAPTLWSMPPASAPAGEPPTPEHNQTRPSTVGKSSLPPRPRGRQAVKVR